MGFCSEVRHIVDVGFPTRVWTHPRDALDKDVLCCGFDNLTCFFHEVTTMWVLIHFVPSYGDIHKYGLCYILFMLYVIQCAIVYVDRTTVNWWWDLGNSSSHC